MVNGLHREMVNQFSASVARITSMAFESGCEGIRTIGADVVKAKFGGVLVESGWKGRIDDGGEGKLAGTPSPISPLPSPVLYTKDNGQEQGDKGFSLQPPVHLRQRADR